MILRDRWFSTVHATSAERATIRPGDEIITAADVVIDRAFTVDATPWAVWPWLVQLGKQRAGWYLPHRIERMLPSRHRAARQLNPRWCNLEIGAVIPDYGRPHDTFQVAEINPPESLVYTSRRGRTDVTWSISVTPAPESVARARVFLRLRMAPVRHVRIARVVGDFFDALTISGMAAGLRERL